MKVLIEGPTTVKLVPESDQETENLEVLWQLLIRCDEDSKVLCPIGAYVAAKDDGAQFTIQDQ
jgi:hypothetical protein